MNVKKILTLFIICFLLGACISKESANIYNGIPNTEVIETITAANDYQVYNQPDDNSQVVGGIRSGESLDIYQKIEKEDCTWMQIGIEKWIKGDKMLISLSAANNWEEMAQILCNGYWISMPVFDDSTIYNIYLSKDISKYNTVNLGLSTDKPYIDGGCDFSSPTAKAIGIASSIEYKRNNNVWDPIDFDVVDEKDEYSKYIFESDDTINKIASFNSTGNCEFAFTYVYDYSRIQEGKIVITSTRHISTTPYQLYNSTQSRQPLYSDTTSDQLLSYYAYDTGFLWEGDVTYTWNLYYYPTLEKALEEFEDGSIGEIEILAKVINIRKGSFINKKTDNKVGEAKTGDKFKVYRIWDDRCIYTNDQYVWYQIDNDKWIADDGTWLKYTPYQPEQR